MPGRAVPRSPTRACDALVLAGVAFLVAFAPLAFGSVHPPAYRTLQAIALLLVCSWCARTLGGRPHPDGEPVLPRSLLMWIAAALGFVAVQLVPLPPALLHAISPSTHDFYATALPGWPERAPYADAVERRSMAQHLSRLMKEGRIEEAEQRRYRARG